MPLTTLLPPLLLGLLVLVIGAGVAAARSGSLATVTVDGGRVVVAVRGVLKALAFKGRLEFPVGHLVGAWYEPQARERRNLGLRMPGTALPGLVAGTYLSDEGRSFWVYGTGDNAVVLELREEPYDYLVVEVADPQATVAALRAALRS
jgi:hypothetical protein